MNLSVQIMQMVLPVLVMIGLGWFCKYKRIISEEGLEGLKSVIGNITLPVVLFNAFFTAEYNTEVLIVFIFVFISCGVALCIGFGIRRFVKPYGKFAPFLMTNFEGGMLGYALFGMLTGGAVSTFAMVDIGQAIFVYTVYLVTLKTVGGSKATACGIVENMVKSPACVGMFAGVLLGILGVHEVMMTTPVGGIVNEVLQFISLPTAGIILLIMGYQLSIKKAMIKPVCITVGSRLLVMSALLGICSIGIFSIIPFDKSLQIALMLMFALPAPFIIPLFVDVKEDGEYISTTLSVSTLLTIILFSFICIYSMA